MTTSYVGQNIDTTPSSPAKQRAKSAAPVPVGSLVLSEKFLIGGLQDNVSVPVVVSGGEVAVNDGAFNSRRVWVKNGDAIQLRHIASAQFAAVTRSVVTVGGMTSKWAPDAQLGDIVTYSLESLTENEDKVPESFSFASQENISKGSYAVSASVVITGINSPTDVNVVSGEFSLGCNGSFGNAPAKISNNMAICVRHLHNNYDETLKTTLTIGTVTADFSSKSVSKPADQSGGGGGGGAFDWLLLSAILFFSVSQRKR